MSCVLRGMSTHRRLDSGASKSLPLTIRPVHNFEPGAGLLQRAAASNVPGARPRDLIPVQSSLYCIRNAGPVERALLALEAVLPGHAPLVPEGMGAINHEPLSAHLSGTGKLCVCAYVSNCIVSTPPKRDSRVPDLQRGERERDNTTGRERSHLSPSCFLS